MEPGTRLCYVKVYHGQMLSLQNKGRYKIRVQAPTNKITWTAQNELYMTLIGITLTYLKKAAEMTNAIIDEETDNVGQFNEN